MRHIRFALIASEVRLLKCNGTAPRKVNTVLQHEPWTHHRRCALRPDIDHELPENLWTISRIWNLSEDLKARIRAPAVPETWS